MKTTSFSTLRRACLAALVAAAALPSGAQNFPTKPVFLYTTAAGGGADYAARQTAQGVAVNTGQHVVVETRGGSPIIPAQAVVKAPADGYTILFYSNAVWILPLLQKNAPYDP